MVPGPAGESLTLFDPAFASDRIPALLAPIKATYHNVFAHPLWLYYPTEADWPEVKVGPGEVNVTGAGAQLSPLRRQLLDSLTESVWHPLLRALSDSGTLPADWRLIVRSALAACPLLVTNLISSARPDPVKYLGLAHVIAAGYEPTSGSDEVSRWLDELASALR